MRKYLLFCLAFCVLGCLAQDLIVRPNDLIIYKKEGGAFLWLGDTAWELFHVLDKLENEDCILGFYLLGRVMW